MQKYIEIGNSFLLINVQAICDSNLQFLDVVSRWQGSAHDSRIFNILKF
jgi:hypothetical protein